MDDALFEEWQGELDQYTSPSLRRDSERQLKATRKRYETLIGSMRKAERSIEPVLAALKDNVLYLKHNLNARAIASLEGSLGEIEDDVASLIRDIGASIKESERFLETLSG